MFFSHLCKEKCVSRLCVYLTLWQKDACGHFRFINTALLNSTGEKRERWAVLTVDATQYFKFKLHDVQSCRVADCLSGEF